MRLIVLILLLLLYAPLSPIVVQGQDRWLDVGDHIYIRVFKSEDVLEVWRSRNGGKYTLMNKYSVCAMSGGLGPKWKQGDRQVPEGVYRISGLNPNSRFYLSLEINYPNRADIARSPHKNLGGDIFIHGSCASLGCVSITDTYIEEVYRLVEQARSNGQQHIPVHIFPARLSELKMGILQKMYASKPNLVSFWQSLAPIYRYFEEHHRLPTVSTNADGRYDVQ